MPERDWNEQRTRKEYIDKLILNSKWKNILKFEDGKTYE